MEASPWNKILFFPGEDPEALKTRFIELLATNTDQRFTIFQLADHVFRGLRDPQLRAGTAATTWDSDPEVHERVRLLRLKGKPPVAERNHEAELTDRLYAIMDDPTVSDKNKIAAAALIAKLKGIAKKEIEPGANDDTPTSQVDFLKALSARLPG